MENAIFELLIECGRASSELEHARQMKVERRAAKIGQIRASCERRAMLVVTLNFTAKSSNFRSENSS